MFRNQFLCAAVVLGCCCHVAAAAEKPNLILFISDDVSWNDHGCYGNKVVRTPVIDRLAARGLRFDQAFLTASSCSPSRSSIITGRYPHNNGKAAELHQPISANLAWFPAMMKTAGYYTVLSGKNHMSVGKAPRVSRLPDSMTPGITPAVGMRKATRGGTPTG